MGLMTVKTNVVLAVHISLDISHEVKSSARWTSPLTMVNFLISIYLVTQAHMFVDIEIRRNDRLSAAH